MADILIDDCEDYNFSATVGDKNTFATIKGHNMPYKRVTLEDVRKALGKDFRATLGGVDEDVFACMLRVIDEVHNLREQRRHFHERIRVLEAAVEDKQRECGRHLLRANMFQSQLEKVTGANTPQPPMPESVIRKPRSPLELE